MIVLGIAPAQASVPPRFLPLRDVAVAYQVAMPGRAAAAYQLSFDAAAQRVRIEDPAHGDYFLVDLPAGTARLVVPALRAVVDAPDLSALTQQLKDADNARFTPLGHATYAGHDCEKYLVLNSQGSGTACITPDGVTLNFAGGNSRGSATVTATSVTYAPLAADSFNTPDGFTAITLPPGALAQFLGAQ